MSLLINNARETFRGNWAEATPAYRAITEKLCHELHHPGSHLIGYQCENFTFLH